MQAVYNIAEICARHGITDVVLSPGSRSAPLTLAFARHPDLNVRVVPDERAAAFIGLGIAQAQRRAVALVCTSGTAGLNYAPAVAEAFFQQIPLVIFTADRPPEWIDQLDGQTIRQRNLYGAHAKGEFEFPVDTSHADAKWHSARIVNEAINLAQAAPAGPVQVNVPLREPFYPKAGEGIGYEKDVKIVHEHASNATLSPAEILELHQQLRAAGHVLVVAGQQPNNPGLLAALYEFAKARKVAVVGDIIANVGEVAAVQRQDIFLAGLGKDDKAALKPDLLITFGQSLISKSLKLFLRDAAPAQHWHLQAAGEAADTFRSLTRVVRVAPAVFFQQLSVLKTSEGERSEGSNPSFFANNQLASGSGSVGSTEYATWQRADAAAAEFLKFFFVDDTQPFNEFSAFRHTLATLPEQVALHLANSMAVRYANILGIPQGRQIEVFANRGTSGIDGCNSTAVGAALAQPGRPVVLLTGDVAFFYDRNAFWHNYPLPNLRVVLFNNHGGGIFRIIDGPRQQPELDEFFETRQLLTAENTAKDFNLRYFPVSSFAELEAALPVFFAAETGAAILEVFTDSKTNAAFFEEYRSAVKQAFS
ncbi:2-succinyl-5-enolpyruvyl-6-hydroxy-3-cyclohexene-1-carboxylic-acid synthase [Microvirga sp. STS02]|uniref:2-succinyl-5-enolpyruvyl-6-hydroxy-3- cyclohexene-1-carboxylic-acid synthase n=1 Tax=Hymenobacter negativus TaxID=2795026 RepID=UPI0018DC99A0|nr:MULTISPECIES: 2-succinyl-5-enolpyruvyl-6-hydroxy-3-cyclohexene-1-carboxylic-acid synthase [Bacteria]MBH8570998.1 2-succinyl-5-enolpyruvyl-6-hydroxy-3-cyclohexene-1-carboxylic-acid synthase [Hymenobacter negativus]MBR7210736.1 2-succinyl-5-enolpyruvyl-6-hydroxy-3-cyclohexene-1-carboxylic-acid synthase [Microvirga sp. STS02]